MNIAISINQQAQHCAKMCVRDFEAARHDHAGADKILRRIAERLMVSFPDEALGLQVAMHPHPEPFRAMLSTRKWRYRIKAGILNGRPQLATLPIERLLELEEAGFNIQSIFNALLARAEEQDDPQVFHLALSSLDFDRITRHSMVPRWIERCTPARAAVMADFLRAIGHLAPQSLENVFSFSPLTGDQQFLSPKLVLAAEFFFEGASAGLSHQGDGDGGFGMAVARALRSNHGKMSLLGRWPTLEARLGLTRSEIEEVCPPG